MDWGAEAEAHARDVRGGVAHIEVDESRTSEHGALLIVTTLVGAERAERVRPLPASASRAPT